MLVALNSVGFDYAETPVYESLDLDIPRGGITVIMGPSGCGKSTLLSLIGGRLQPRCGNVVVDDVDVQSLDKRGLYHLRRRMGMLFQFNALLSELSVFENVAFPMREHTDLPAKLIDHLSLIHI